MYKVCYWDAEAKVQRERDATPEETAEIEARKTAPPIVPSVVTSRQAMLALIDKDKDAEVAAVLASIAGKPGKRAKAEYERAQEWRRDWPLLNQIRQALGWTDQFVDDLFIYAQTL